MTIENYHSSPVRDRIKWSTGLTNHARKELVGKKLIENKSGKYELTEWEGGVKEAEGRLNSEAGSIRVGNYANVQHQI